MTVGELIRLLQECDEDAEVRVMMQENWPFECQLDGIAVREDFVEAEECFCDHKIAEPHEDGCPAGAADGYEDGLRANDVFLVEGMQERYGSKMAWEVVRRW
jgi:hypothetical protein